MEKNVGGYDRLARLVVGPVLLVVGLVGVLGSGPVTSPVGAGLLVFVGLVLFATGATQRCPVHSIVGLNTNPDR